MWAARWGDLDRVQALITAGADPAARDGKGLSALDYAKSRSDGEQSEQIIELIGSAS